MNPSTEHRHLRSALEFAVLMANEGQKLKPPMKFPSGLKKFLKSPRIPTGSLPALCRVVEADDDFRQRLGRGAVPELVDEVGLLWLQRPDGWQVQIAELVAAIDSAAADADLATQLRRSEKRREAAASVAARSQAELVALGQAVTDRDQVIEGLRSDLVKYRDELDAVKADLIDVRLEARHARDREAAAVAKVAAADAAVKQAQHAQHDAEHVRDDVLAHRADEATDRSELARLAATAEALAAQLAALSADPEGGSVRRRPERRALPLPGGVLGSSASAAEYLLRSGASVLIDGYNVAKLAWPRLDLTGQRVVLLDVVENMARRFGSDITVVFDGADVIGATADGRRVIRVMYSPSGVTADDVIRDEVGRLPPTRPVVVVTSDQEIVRDVRAMGANTLFSDQLLLLA
ncbi:MAG TPA: NYN domain-containing protein [Ilumatobacter sp.]|nr:NYN domain-containing protein [Ilumatobacter sp.]